MKFVNERLEGHDVLIDIEMRTRHKIEGTMEDVILLYDFTKPFIALSQDADINIVNRVEAEKDKAVIGRVAISGSESSIVYYDEHTYGIFLYTTLSPSEIENFANTFFGKFNIEAVKSIKNDWLVEGKKLGGSVSIPPWVYLLSFSAKTLDIDKYYDMKAFPEGKVKPSERMSSLESILGRIPTIDEIRTKVEETILEIFGSVEKVEEHLPDLFPEEYEEALTRYTDPDWIKWGITKILEINPDGLVVEVHDDIPSNIDEGNYLLKSSQYSQEDLEHKNIYIKEVIDGEIITTNEYSKELEE